ncbi:MAG: hypothetical protein PUD47_03685 [Bacteroidales bacterium]|nr:hypothetical protein [Bacteroidales bacterium]
MDQLMIVANVAIVFGVIYKLFELCVGRKERMMLIEKLGELQQSGVSGKGPLFLPTRFSFGALRLGCLMAGVGLGLLVGYFIIILTAEGCQQSTGLRMHELTSVIYGSSVMLFGGMGLIVSYWIESRWAKSSSSRPLLPVQQAEKVPEARNGEKTEEAVEVRKEETRKAEEAHSLDGR